MNRLAAVVVLGVLAAVLSGCGGKPGARNIIVGDKLSDAVSMLTKAGARDISDTVQIQPEPPARFVWFELKDRTCVCLTCEPNANKEDVIVTIEVGDAGAGYNDKIEWEKQNVRPVPQLALEEPP